MKLCLQDGWQVAIQDKHHEFLPLLNAPTTTYSLSLEDKSILALIQDWLPKAKYEINKLGHRIYTDNKHDAYVMLLLSLLKIKMGRVTV